MSRKVSIFSVIVVMTITVLATVAVAFAAQSEDDSGEENGQGKGLEKVTICHNGHTITVGAPGADAHLLHHEDDADGSCPEVTAPDEGTTAPEPPGGTTPTLTTLATTTATVGGTISDTATLSAATTDATGTITFSAYGPFVPATDPTTDVCDGTTLAYESPTPIDIGSPDLTTGDFVVSSDDFTPTEAGRYQWVASYSGDANNGAVESVCNAEGEQSVVNDATSTGATEQNVTVASEVGSAGEAAKGSKDPDTTNGTVQSDKIAGGGGPDLIRGLLDGDLLFGDQGADTLYGNADDDLMQGGSGPDAMSGGPGNDVIDSVDAKGGNDQIDGGVGIDHCVGDAGDTFINCDGNVVEVAVP